MASRDFSGADQVDAVFVIGTGSKNGNEELRYALRNVARNCPFVRRVYISGECPKWVDTSVVVHLPWRDRFKHAKDSNIVDKLVHACEAPGIAKRILFCSDDQFQTRVCTWEDFAPVWLRKYSKDDPWYEDRKRIWHSRLHRTLERERLRRVAYGMGEGGIYYWEPHIYSPIDRDLFLRFAEWSDYAHRDDTITQTAYYNFIGQRGEHSQDHTFIWSGYKWDKPTTHIAYTDEGFGAAMEYLRKTFPESCRFEKQASAGKSAMRGGAPVAAQSVNRPGAAVLAAPSPDRMPGGRYYDLYAEQLARIRGRKSLVADAGDATDAGVAAFRAMLPDADVYRVGGTSSLAGVTSVTGDCYSTSPWAGVPSGFDIIALRAPAVFSRSSSGIVAAAARLAAGGLLVIEDIASYDDASFIVDMLPGSVLHRIPRVSSNAYDMAVSYTMPVI